MKSRIYFSEATDNYDTVTTKVMKCAINNRNLQIVVCKSFVIIQVTVEHLDKMCFQRTENVN